MNAGAKKHSDRLRRLTNVQPTLRKVVYAAADMLAAEAALSITAGAASGTSGGKHQHIASLPGQPPNAFTGKLDRSIHVERVDDLTARVVADAPHAVALEFGTSRMEPRPFMQPAAQLVRPQMDRLIAAAIKKLGS